MIRSVLVTCAVALLTLGAGCSFDKSVGENLTGEPRSGADGSTSPDATVGSDGDRGGACDPASCSGVCRDGLCVSRSCTDDEKNGGETDVDCGGPECNPCQAGGACADGDDCRSGVCNGGTCAPATCNDGTRNGGETDIDCGGPGCTPCRASKSCSDSSDCISDVCAMGTCREATCNDGTRNGRETYTDCGGPKCPKCKVGEDCSQDSDCETASCNGHTCQPPSCSDGAKNGNETGVDCGGSCAGCPNGTSCNTGMDCRSGNCSGGSCAPRSSTGSCQNQMQNGQETDVDCGGPKCPKCPNGSSCQGPSDCQSGRCKSGVCRPQQNVATCNDGVKNNNETDVDCGGSCGRCDYCERCAGDADCPAAGSCQAGRCTRIEQVSIDWRADCNRRPTKASGLPRGRYRVTALQSAGALWDKGSILGSDRWAYLIRCDGLLVRDVRTPTGRYYSSPQKAYQNLIQKSETAWFGGGDLRCGIRDRHCADNHGAVKFTMQLVCN